MREKVRERGREGERGKIEKNKKKALKVRMEFKDKRERERDT